MAFRKIQASKIFDGKKILDNKVLILDEKNVVVEVTTPEEAGDQIDYKNGILSPGFINCHCHLELSHMQSMIEEHTGLMDFVGKIMRLRPLPEVDILKAIQQADQAMYQNGIVAVGDICNTLHTYSQKKNSPIFYHNFIEIAGFLPQQAEERMNNGVRLKKEYATIGPSTIVPHAPYSVSETLLEKINLDANKKTITIHNEETKEENLFFQEKKGAFLELYNRMHVNIDFFSPSGRSSLQTYLPYLNKPASILLVHNTCASREDIVFAEKFAQENGQDLYWTLCPNANWYIERKLPPIDLLKVENATICLGTDSLASNYALSIWSEIQRIQKHCDHIPLEDLLTWATSNGAKALNISDQYGSFEKGKKPGVICIDQVMNKIERIA